MIYWIFSLQIYVILKKYENISSIISSNILSNQIFYNFLFPIIH